MVFNANSKQHSTFHIGEQNIEIVIQYKYLGVIIDNHPYRLPIKQKLKTNMTKRSLVARKTREPNLHDK